jgi:hypothetical protein
MAKQVVAACFSSEGLSTSILTSHGFLSRSKVIAARGGTGARGKQRVPRKGSHRPPLRHGTLRVPQEALVFLKPNFDVRRIKSLLATATSLCSELKTFAWVIEQGAKLSLKSGPPLEANHISQQNGTRIKQFCGSNLYYPLKWDYPQNTPGRMATKKHPPPLSYICLFVEFVTAVQHDTTLRQVPEQTLERVGLLCLSQ